MLVDELTAPVRFLTRIPMGDRARVTRLAVLAELWHGEAIDETDLDRLAAALGLDGEENLVERLEILDRLITEADAIGDGAPLDPFVDEVPPGRFETTVRESLLRDRVADALSVLRGLLP